MKKALLIFLLILGIQASALASFTEQNFQGTRQMSDVVVFSDEDKFGLKDKNGDVVVEAEFVKLIRLGNTSWIAQKGNKFGIMNSDGDFIVKPKYRNVERILGKYVKLGNDNDFGLYDEFGKVIIPPEYSRIDLLFGGMFLTCKNYKYGVMNSQGEKVLPNKFDDIYMPQANVMRLQLNGKWYEVETANSETLVFPTDVEEIERVKITELISNPIAGTGYSVVSFADYFVKIFSSISPAYEDTIDELMLSKGADTVSIFMKAAWLPKFPFTYAKMYYKNFRTPNNGPLSEVKDNLKQKMN
ncbi:WG repeat-containing protein [bacterium]|nr:WG repeat-containing protein [bacterium]